MTTNGKGRSSESHAQEHLPDTASQGNSSDATSEQSFDQFGRYMVSRLSRIIEGDIIPRLMLALDSPSSSRKDQAIADRLRDNVDEFVHLILAHDAPVAVRYVSTLRTDGIPLSALYLDLLAPAARRLGELWELDECTFTDVTIGVCRMNQVLLEFSRCFDATTGQTGGASNALILPIPGEQHTFGILMVMEFMRRGGWNCYTGNPPNTRDAMKLVRSQDFDVIGLSLSSDKNIDTMRKLIADIRHGARNADTVVLAGGRAFVEDPDLVAAVGADATAADGKEAVEKLRRIREASQNQQSN